MEVVAAGVAEVVLHVPDDWILPVQNVQGTVAADFHVAGAEIAIGRVQDGFDFLREEASTLLFKLVLSHSLEPDHVSDQQIAAIGFREVLAVQNGDRRNRAYSFFVQLLRSPMTRHADVIASSACAVRRELIAPLIENIAVWIWTDWELKIDIKGNRIPFVNSGTAGVESLCGSPRSFKILGVKNPAREVELPAGAHHEPIGRMMRVGRIESEENTFADIGNIVAVEVFQEQDIRGLSDQNTAVPEFKSCRIVQTIGERDAAIRNAVMIFVRENQEFVVHGTQRIPMRIRRPCGNPQATIRIDGTLNGVGEV